MNWQDRIDNMILETGFPENTFVSPSGEVWGYWVMGNNYKVASGFYGGYPNTYLRRIRGLFPDKRRVLHLFSGLVDIQTFPGDTVDINPLLRPTYVCKVPDMGDVPLETYDLILADPPYTDEDAVKYGTCQMPDRNEVMRTLGRRALPGTHVVWLDQMSIMYRKDQWRVEASIALERSTNHRFRCVKIFCRKEPGE